MTAFHPALAADQLWDGEMAGVTVAGVAVLLLDIGGRVYAYEDRCAHQAVPLSRGSLDGRTLVCGAHAWSYDACSGCGLNPESVQLRSLPVRIEQGQILVDISAAASALRMNP